MLKTLKSISAPLASLVILLLGSGLFTTYMTVRLRMEGYDSSVAGYVTAAYYVGLFLGSFRGEKIISRLGMVPSYALFAALVSVIVLLQGLFLDPWFWVFMRFLVGLCNAALFIILESWFLMKSTKESRGKILSVYMIVFYGAVATGQLLLDSSDPRSFVPFATIAALSSLSILPLAFIKRTDQQTCEPSFLHITTLFKASPLGFLGCIISGVLLGTTFGLAPSYAKELQMNLSEIGFFMSLTILGGLALQWPLGQLSDHIDRSKVIALASFATFISSLLIVFMGNSLPGILLMLAFLYGGFSFTLYPLCLSYSCDFLNPKDFVAASGGLQIAYGLGAVIGPMTAPFSMEAFGPGGLYLYFAAISLLFGMGVILTRGKKIALAKKTQVPFVPLPEIPVASDLKKPDKK